ncbi:M23 family metallopeptidase [Sanguibacter antarcticus]|uniref:Peptidase M23-like protein n=1 Tax=Sanguibacter antarcticus TaxID=372484 RepID=A0A2A9E3M2_9MICO|nr:M23 family metallopeptidase [Sanguibacter antarcticus]PFG33548.1 peptidase M23-like protein [Sanguibacter antarcticus]
MTTDRTGLRPSLTALVTLVVAAVLTVTVASTSEARAPSAHEDRYVLPSGDAPAGTTRAELQSSGVLVRDFEPPTVRWGAGHRGVDLRSGDGATVVAPQAGVVTFVGVVVDRPLIVISHPDGLRSTLEPVTSTLTTGTSVGRGDVLGSLAPDVATHCAPDACLHWGVRRAEEYIDPLELVVEREAVILLPLDHT